MPCIYKIESPTAKIYIGQTWNFEKRMINYKGLFCKTQNKLYNSLKKYGFENHVIDILYEFPSDVEQNVLDVYEETYMSQYRNCGIELLNLRSAGSRGKHTLESIEKMKGRKQNFTADWKSKISKTIKLRQEVNGAYRSKQVGQYDMNGKELKIWKSAREAAIVLGFKFQGISRCATGRNKSGNYKNYIWKFI